MRMNQLMVLNVAAPLALAALCILTAGSDDFAVIALASFTATLLILAVLNVVAPFVLWRAHGAKSLLALAVFLAAAAVSAFAELHGSRAALAHTPMHPDAFLSAATESELEQMSEQLLAGNARSSIVERLGVYGFRRVEVDTARRTVLLGHARLRRWYEYVYSPDGTPPDSTRHGAARPLDPKWYFRSW